MRVMLCLLLICSSLGCVLWLPEPPRPIGGSRGVIHSDTVDGLLGFGRRPTAREVLLVLGDPDRVSKRRGRFRYSWTVHSSSVGVVGPGPPALVVPLYTSGQLDIWFDDERRARKYDYRKRGATRAQTLVRRSAEGGE